MIDPGDVCKTLSGDACRDSHLHKTLGGDTCRDSPYQLCDSVELVVTDTEYSRTQVW